MSFRVCLMAAAAFALAGCSLFSHRPPASDAAAVPVHETLARTLSGDVRFDLDVPPDAYIQLTLQDVSVEAKGARTVAQDRIQPVGQSPVEFFLSYDPASLNGGTDYLLNVSLQQGDKLLASNTVRVEGLDRKNSVEPVSVTLQPAK